LSIYKKYFQDRFIDETKQYYKTESSNFIQNNSVVAYMKKVDHISSEHIPIPWIPGISHPREIQKPQEIPEFPTSGKFCYIYIYYIYESHINIPP